MGVMRLMGTLLKHPATKGALMENVPLIDCLMIDYNANIHYILQKVIVELNEILYYTYHRDNHFKNIHFVKEDARKLQMPDINEYNLNLEINAEDLQDKIERYHEDYQLGTTYQEISKNLQSNDKITDIIFYETINYTRQLICSLNKGFIKKVYLALDGVPSMAKIKEQKNRRYIGSYINNIKEELVKKYKIKNDQIHQLNLFKCRSSICAGTKFMDRIEQSLFHLDIGLDIDVSTVRTKGEGEKKIIHALEIYCNYSNYCIMSPDSDMLILIGLLSNNSKFQDKQLYNFRIDYLKNHQYQFFDLKQLLENFRKYYSSKIGKEVTTDKMLDMLFMLAVFGNDFLPKLEPLDITQHFDLVCETCLKLSMEGNHFIINDKLNYHYLLDFFRMINKDIIFLSVEQTLNSKYNNYFKLCKNMSLTSEDLKHPIHHPELHEIIVNHENFHTCLTILNTCFTRLINYLKETIIGKENIKTFYQDIHSNKDDSYLLLVLPKLLKFPESDANLDPYTFFEKFIEYTNNMDNFGAIKFRTRLMPRSYNQTCVGDGTTAYLVEVEKLNYSMEPYRSMFKMAPIILMDFDIANGKIVDLRDKYYQTYVKQNISQTEIEKLVFDYMVGIEWLYQYYISGKHMEWSGWQYKHTQPPLIDDIIKYLETNPSCGNDLDTNLATYPENTFTPEELYLYVTPNDYTQAGISPNIADVIPYIDGYGAIYLNKCQIKWHEFEKN